MQDLTILDQLKNDCKKAAQLISASNDILIVSHIDADGITSAAIAATTCKRLGKEYRVVFAKKMSEEIIEQINCSKESVVWITDLGSGYVSRYDRDNIVITDHHIPDSKWHKGQTSLFSFNRIEHLNPHLYGMDGSTEVCGAGMTYLLSKSIDDSNIDLAQLAVVGACGDIQDTSNGLVGLNKLILQDAVDNGDISVVKDLRLFGRETRNLIQFLQYSSDPKIPILGENGIACSKLYSSLDIPLKDGTKNRCWNDLSPNEKERVTSAIRKMMAPEDFTTAFGDTYIFNKHKRHSELRDGKEYATLLNSCGRYDDAETGMYICMGDQNAIEKAKKNRNEHRQNISTSISLVKEKQLVKICNSIQYFNAGSEIKETVVGIVASMILNTEGFRRDLPIIAFADAEDGVKVSARADRSLVDRGLNLAFVMEVASEIVGGYGGGHNIAAGATIPKGKEKEFLEAVNDIVAAQII